MENEIVKKHEIDKAISEAYKKAGANAYFGEGFRAGINYAEAYHKENMREVLIEFEVMARKNAFGLPEKSYLDNDLKDNVAGMVDNFLKERDNG